MRVPTRKRGASSNQPQRIIKEKPRPMSTGVLKTRLGDYWREEDSASRCNSALTTFIILHNIHYTKHVGRRAAFGPQASGFTPRLTSTGVSPQ